jgi:hypothetical protein
MKISKTAMMKGRHFACFGMKLAVSAFILLGTSHTGRAQSLTANDDVAYIGPLETARVDVVRNDMVPCNNHSLRIVQYDQTQGTATLEGDYIVFTPLSVARNRSVAIRYGLTCNHTEVTATLTVHVSNYNLPANVIAQDVKCWTPYPSNVAFDVGNKFNTNTAQPAHVNDILVYTLPLVGDLNGDRKPEILATGLIRGNSSVTASARYITIMDGQTGETLVEHNAGFDFAVSSDNPNASAYHSSPSYMAIADVDNDGKGEVIMAFPGSTSSPVPNTDADNGRVIAYKVQTDNSNRITGLTTYWTATVGYKSPLTNTRHLSYDVPAPYIADLNGDGIPEVVVYNKIYNAQTGRLLMAWDGPAASARSSSLAPGTGLEIYDDEDIYTDPAISGDVYGRAFTGRRPSTSSSAYKDDYIAVFAVENMDADDDLEVIAGNRIYKFRLNYLGRDGESGSHADNTYTTVEGPRSVTLPTTRNYTVTYYLSDGFTRVADVDGDGRLDVINISEVATTGNYGSRAAGLITVWDPADRHTGDSIKAAAAFHGNGGTQTHIPTFGIPFVGDINGKLDGGWDGTQFTRKLPEIGFITGDLYINSSNSTPRRNGITFHPLSDVNLRQGVGWDNNNTSTSSRRFNRSVSGGQGHIFAVTCCDSAGAVPFHRRLKLSWAMEHDDRSCNTGLTIFDFNNDGAKDLVYRDEETLLVISPKYGGVDYVTIGEKTGTSSSVLFRTTAYSYTGYEAPVIADVNMDASADIVVTNVRSRGEIRGWVSVFEYKNGFPKWAPAPPVWNQAYYNPLHVREDLTIPACPQSPLTAHSLNGETVTPYNGAWVQQPVVREGNYTPVIRLPDAVLIRMAVSSGNPTQVTLTVHNRGTASIHGSTPVTFRDGGSTGTGLLLESSSLIATQEIGVDIFPNETVTKTYTLPGNYSNHLVWARIMDDGAVTPFPAAGYEDCRTDDGSNRISASDCVPECVITASPDTLVCGHGGGHPIVLTVTGKGNPKGSPVTYQWYRDEMIIPQAVSQSYSATLAGDYTCFVSEGICQGFTPVKTLTTGYMSAVNDTVAALTVPIRVDVLANDDTLTCRPAITIVAGSEHGPRHGSVTVEPGNILLYMPVTGYAGLDSVTYQLADGIRAKVYITVIARTFDDVQTVQKYHSTEINVLANDNLPPALFTPPFSLLDSVTLPPRNGRLIVTGSGAGSRFIYTNTGTDHLEHRIDSFRYRFTFYSVNLAAWQADSATAYIYVLEDRNGASVCHNTPDAVRLAARPQGVAFEWYTLAGQPAGSDSIRPLPAMTLTGDTSWLIRPVVPDMAAPWNRAGGFPKGAFSVRVADTVPSFMRWTGLASHDWLNPNNWVEIRSTAGGRRYETPVWWPPSACTDVEIPSDVPLYPELTDSVRCCGITLRNRAMLKNPHMLDYGHAGVELRFSPLERDRFVMWSAPLRDMYSGDYHFNDRNGQPRWGDVYMNLFQQDHPAGGTARPDMLTATFGEPGLPLPLGTAFNLKVIATTASRDSLWRFPQSASVYTDARHPAGAHALVRNCSHRFITDSVALTGHPPVFDLPVAGGSLGGTKNMVQIVNPYLAYLDVFQFMAGNTELAGGYLIWNGHVKNGFTAVRPGDAAHHPGMRYIYTGPAPSASLAPGYIPPLQSFFVSRRTPGSSIASVKMSPEWTTTAPPGLTGAYQLRSTVAKEEGVLRICASQGDRTAYAVAYFDRSASPEYSVREDVRMLFFDENPLTVYLLTLLGEPLAIHASGDFESRPTGLGLRIVETGEVRLTFSGMETFGHRVYLIDREKRLEIDLQQTPEYVFTVVRPSVVRAAEIDRRFALRMEYTGEGLAGREKITPSAWTAVSRNGEIHVRSTRGVIRELRVYSLTGALLYAAADSATEYRIPAEPGSVCLVRANIDGREETKKVMVRD